MEELRERNDTLKEEKVIIESQRDEEASNIVSIFLSLTVTTYSSMGRNGIKTELMTKPS
jgi:hypothetical protein